MWRYIVRQSPVVRTKEKSAALLGSCGFFCIFAVRSQKNEKESH